MMNRYHAAFRFRGPELWVGMALMQVLALASVARAQDGKRVAVFVVQADAFSEKAAAMLQVHARQSFKDAPEFQYVDVRSFFDEDAPDERRGNFAQARRLFASGKNQYDNLELDAAIYDLSGALDSMEKAVGRLDDGSEYLQVLLYLGASFLLAGDTDKGQDKFRRAVLFDPSREIDQRMFPPSMIELFEQLRSEVSTAPTGGINVSSSPEGGEVFFDGQYKGVAPLQLAKIPEGEHVVRIEKDGFLPWGRLVRCRPSTEQRIDANLEATPRLAILKSLLQGVVGKREEDPPAKEMQDFAMWLGVDQVVLGVAQQRGTEIEVEAVLIQATPARLRATRAGSVQVTDANLAGRARALFTSLFKDTKEPPPVVRECTTSADCPMGKVCDSASGACILQVAGCSSDSDCSIGEVCDSKSRRCIPYAPPGKKLYEKWWFWAAVGGGLAVIGGTTALVLHLTQPEEGAIEFRF